MRTILLNHFILRQVDDGSNGTIGEHLEKHDTMNNSSPQTAETPVALYETEGGAVRVSPLVKDETLWLSQVARAATQQW